MHLLMQMKASMAEQSYSKFIKWLNIGPKAFKKFFDSFHPYFTRDFGFYVYGVVIALIILMIIDFIFWSAFVLV